MENSDFFTKLSSRSLLRHPSPEAKIPFQIRTLGTVNREPTHLTRGTYFEDAMLTWFQAGEGRYTYGSRHQRVCAGMLGLVLPEDEPGFLHADPDNPYRHIYCRFAGGEALRMAREIRAGMPASFAYHPRAPEAGGCLETMLAEKASHRLQGEKTNFMSRVEARLAELLARLLHPPQPSRRRSLGREELSAHILGHLHEPVSLDHAAAAFGLSRAHFNRETKRLLGITYQKAVEREKMIWSTTLLRDPGLNLNVSEVAYRLGYADPLYFSKVFKKHHGIPPSEFRVT